VEDASRPADAVEERRVVSTLFCDLAGFTRFSESADPEDVQRLLERYHEVVRRRVTAYGGRVERLVGDGVLAVFGSPTVREDDAERAVRSALSVVESLSEHAEGTAPFPLPVRVGVATGEVLLAVSRTSAAEGNWVAGDSVNVASRLQASADPGTVVVGDTTYQATSRVFEYVQLDPLDAKGKSEPVVRWRPVGAVLPFGAEVYLDLEIPLVGRELELQHLRTTFDRVVRESGVQLVTVLGDPGVGKSRLVSEFLALLPTDVICRIGRVPPYGESTGFSALAQVVKAHAGIYDTDPADEIQRKLATGLAGAPDHEWLVARLLSQLGTDAGTDMTRDEAQSVWRGYLAYLAGNGPAVVVLEDVHQADPGLLQFLLELVEDAPRVPLMLVATSRPELLSVDTHWGGGLRNHSLMNLLPLSDVETRTLLRTMLADFPLPSESERAILGRAEGNPLFTAEFVRMLRARDLVEPLSRGNARPFVDIPLPETVKQVIAARLDLVEGHTRGVLQDAAIFGRTFWTSGVAALAGRELSDVAAELRRLANLDIVRPTLRSRMAGEIEHAFTHSLVRDAAYDQLKRSTKAVKHLRAADWLEQHAADATDELAEDLAYHASTALDLLLATGDSDQVESIRVRLLGYYLSAADTAESVSALPKALAHVHAACSLLDSLPDAPRRRPELLARRARLRWLLDDVGGSRADAVSALRAAEVSASVIGPELQMVLPLARGELWLDDPENDPASAGLRPPRPEEIAVPAGRESHRWEEESGWTAPTFRARTQVWEIWVSQDRGFYDHGPVDLPFPPPARERRIPLLGPEAMVGRGHDATVNLALDPIDPAVSRRHALLRRSQAGWTVTQLAEHNPSYLNGSGTLPVGRSVTVGDGDFLNLGGWTRVTLRRSTS